MRTLNDLHGQLLRPAECLDSVEQASGWRERTRQAAAGHGPGHGLLALRQRRRQADPSDRRAARGGQPRLDFDGGITAPDRRRRYRPGLLHHARPDRGRRGARRRARPHARHRHRQRGDAEGQRLLFLARHLHGGQRGDRRRRDSSRRCSSPRRRASSRRAPTTSNAPARRSASAAASDPGLAFRRRGGGGAGRRRRDHRQGHLHHARRIPGRQASRRRRRLDHGLQLRRAGRRGQRRRRHRHGHASRRSGWRTIAAAPSTRSRSKARCRARCGWAWARRCARRRATTKACRCMPACSTTACRRSSESPPIEVHIVESHDPNGPFGAKEASEGSLAGFLPALTNAIADAIGLDLTNCRSRPTACSRRWCSAGARRGSPKPCRPRHDARRFPPHPPASVDDAVAACCQSPGSRFIAGGTDLLVNLRRGIGGPRVLVDLSGIGELTEIAADQTGVTHRRRRDAGRARAQRGDLRPISRARRKPPRRSPARPSRDGDGRRQSLPRHALRLLQSERMVAARQRLLPQVPRHDLPRRAAGPALPRRLQRRSRAGADGLRRRSRDRRRARAAPHPAGRALCRRRQGASGAGRRRAAGRGASAAGHAAVGLSRRRAQRGAIDFPLAGRGRRTRRQPAQPSARCASRSPAPIRGRSCSPAPMPSPVGRSTTNCCRRSTGWCRSRCSRCAPRSPRPIIAASPRRRWRGVLTATAFRRTRGVSVPRFSRQ